MIPLISIIKDPLGGWLALAFILVFAIKMVLALIGGEVEGADVDTDVDVDVDADVNTDGFGFSAADIFSLKGFLNFGVGFTSSWALFGLKGWYAGLAVFVGLVSFVILLLAYRACMKLESKTVHETPQDMMGRVGTVYLANDKTIILQIEKDGRIVELLTRPDSGFTAEDFKTGDYAWISRVTPPAALYCSPYNTEEKESK